MTAYTEGLPVVPNPGIISPQAFTDELFQDRFPNEYLGDTNLRLAVDVSQMVGIRFGETIKAYVENTEMLPDSPPFPSELPGGCAIFWLLMMKESHMNLRQIL